MLLEKGGETRVLRVRIEHTAFLEASLHYRSTYKKWRECFWQLFVPLCQIPLSVRDDMRLVHGMFYSQTNLKNFVELELMFAYMYSIAEMWC